MHYFTVCLLWYHLFLISLLHQRQNDHYVCSICICIHLIYTYYGCAFIFGLPALLKQKKNGAKLTAIKQNAAQFATRNSDSLYKEFLCTFALIVWIPFFLCSYVQCIQFLYASGLRQTNYLFFYFIIFFPRNNWNQQLWIFSFYN